MSEKRESIKVELIVFLTNGMKVCHTYDVPSNYGEASKFVNTKTGEILGALEHPRPSVLFLQNPSIVYNVDNVIGIQSEFIGPKEYEGLIEKLKKRKLGFVKD